MFDVLIVGAGPGGLASAWMLSKAGLKVACIEQGPEHASSLLVPMVDGGELFKYSTLSSTPSVRSLPYEFTVNSSNSPIELEFFSGVGGSTLLFSAQYPRLQPRDFCIRSLTGKSFDWPFTYKDLEPFYIINEEITGLSGLSGDPLNPSVKPNMPPVKIGPMGEKLVEGFNSLGWRWWPSYSAINTVDRGTRPSDNYLRPTNLDYGPSKGSANNTYYPLAVKEGVKFFLNSQALSLHREDSKSNSNICYVRALRDNEEYVIRAKRFVLACGGAGTPRLLLNSKSNENPQGLSNSSRLVGKNLMLHPWGYVQGIFDENILSNHGPQGCCLISQHFYDGPSDRSYTGGFTFQAIRGPLPIEASTALLRQRKIKLDKDFINGFLSNYNHTAHIAVITDDEPDEKNSITLDHTSSRKNGALGIKVNYTLSDNSKRQLSDGINKARKLLKAAGAVSTTGFGPVRHTGWHILGTCRMGKDPTRSVVNHKCQSHDHPNLYIADASVFPTGGSVNPAATVTALALKMSQHLIEELK